MCRTKYSTSWELRSTMADESRMTKTNSSYQRVSSKEWYWSEWRCELHSQPHGSITATERLTRTLCSPGSWPRLFVQKRWIRKINTSDLGSQGTRHMQRQSHLSQSEHGYSHHSLHVIEKSRLVCTILVFHRYSSSGIYFAPGAENVEVSEWFCQSVEFETRSLFDSLTLGVCGIHPQLAVLDLPQFPTTLAFCDPNIFFAIWSCQGCTQCQKPSVYMTIESRRNVTVAEWEKPLLIWQSSKHHWRQHHVRSRGGILLTFSRLEDQLTP